MLAVLASVFTTPSPVAGSATPTATTYSLSSAASPASPSSRQSGPLSLVQIHRDTVLWLVDIMVFLPQLSNALKSQLKTAKAPF